VARVHRRRARLLLTAVVLSVGVFGVNALVAWFWRVHTGWLAALAALDLVAFVVIFAVFHAALDPPRDGSPPARFRRNRK
jgi:uncharacterized membrane protein